MFYLKKFDIYNCMSYIISNILKEILSERMEKPHFSPKNGGLDRLQSIKMGVEKKLKKVYLGVTGEELNLPKIDIKIDNSIKDGKIAGFNHPVNGENGVMGIKEKALNDEEYLKWIITHELIHASVGEDLPKSKEHSGLFNKLADGMGLPKEYRD